MRLQHFARAHEWIVDGEIAIEKDKFARYYADGVRVALTHAEGLFTGLVCTDGQTRYVLTRDWEVAQRMPASAAPIA